jgi:hypothetical protein
VLPPWNMFVTRTRLPNRSCIRVAQSETKPRAGVSASSPRAMLSPRTITETGSAAASLAERRGRTAFMRRRYSPDTPLDRTRAAHDVEERLSGDGPLPSTVTSTPTAGVRFVFAAFGRLTSATLLGEVGPPRWRAGSDRGGRLREQSHLAVELGEAVHTLVHRP